MLFSLSFLQRLELRKYLREAAQRRPKFITPDQSSAGPQRGMLEVAPDTPHNRINEE
jgi:hypothetical protein